MSNYVTPAGAVRTVLSLYGGINTVQSTLRRLLMMSGAACMYRTINCMVKVGFG